MELRTPVHVYSSASLFLALTFTMTTQALLPCDVICSQGITTSDCDCDVTMQQQTTDANDIEKRAANDEYMYNKIFKWGKRKFNNPFASQEERLMPIDNIDRRIFRWGKRSGNSGNRADSRIFRWGKRSEYTPDTIDQSLLSAIDGQIESIDLAAPLEKRGVILPSYPYGGRLGRLRDDLRTLLASEQGLKQVKDKRLTDREALQSRIFRYGKRGGGGDEEAYRTGSKREQRDKLRKIFMWG